MITRTALVLTLLTVAAAGAATLVTSNEIAASNEPAADPGGLTVHEWGTFTTVAGPDGRAVDWLPLGGPTDLPCFVEHFRNRANVKVSPTQAAPPDYAAARASLRAKVRMETPVLYFYSSRPLTANVSVRFPRGLMTEWYPRARVTQTVPDSLPFAYPWQESVIAWQHVAILPNADEHFPVGAGDSHYYAARNTDAAPLAVAGQSEKFLFYRGVASFDVPISATVLDDGRVRARNVGAHDIPGLVLFENRGGAIRYRGYGTLRGESVLAPPSRSATVAEVRREVERMLVKAGLYPKEAAAMVESWRDSWFEEGTRVFYIVPPRAVDAILPLAIQPAPARVERVFVGRMELITSGTERAVDAAVATNDVAVLERYGRFLGPITDRILARQGNAATRQRIRQVTNAAYTTFLRRAASCD